MLNPYVPIRSDERFPDYQLPLKYVEASYHENCSFRTGKELRLQEVFEFEIWHKLGTLGVSPDTFSGKRVLEVCGGTGFFSYHFLSRANPAVYYFNELSTAEMDAAIGLLSKFQLSRTIKFVSADFQDIVDYGFDFIIGNAFLHHFPDVQNGLSKLCSLLSPGGRLILLHEPTPASIGLESGKFMHIFASVFANRVFVSLVKSRYRGEGSFADLWMFPKSDLLRLASKCSLAPVHIRLNGLFRPVLVARLGMVLSGDNPRLSRAKERWLRFSVYADAFLGLILPDFFFGSVTGVFKKR